MRSSCHSSKRNAVAAIVFIFTSGPSRPDFASAPARATRTDRRSEKVTARTAKRRRREARQDIDRRAEEANQRAGPTRSGREPSSRRSGWPSSEWESPVEVSNCGCFMTSRGGKSHGSFFLSYTIGKNAINRTRTGAVIGKVFSLRLPSLLPPRLIHEYPLSQRNCLKAFSRLRWRRVIGRYGLCWCNRPLNPVPPRLWLRIQCPHVYEDNMPTDHIGRELPDYGPHFGSVFQIDFGVAL